MILDVFLRCCNFVVTSACTAVQPLIITRRQGREIDIGPGHEEASGMRHLTSTRDLLLYIPGAGRETLPRPDHHLSQESCHEWIEQNWTWSMWSSCLAADEGCGSLCGSFDQVVSGQHFIPGVFLFIKDILNSNNKKKNIICDTGISWTGDGFDCFFTFRRNSPSPGGGLWQPGSAAAWEQEEETSHVMRHQASGPAGPGHCSIMSRGVIVHPNKVWRTNAEEILISFI